MQSHKRPVPPSQPTASAFPQDDGLDAGHVPTPPRANEERRNFALGAVALTVVLLFVNVFVLGGILYLVLPDSTVQAPWVEEDPRAVAQGPFEPLELVETGWSNGSGYVNVAVLLHNPNKDCRADYPRVIVTGKDKDGRILFTEDLYTGSIQPDSDAAAVGTVGLDKPRPASVEFSVSVPDYGWAVDDQTASQICTVQNTAYVPSGSDDGDITGEVRFQNLSGEEYCEVIALLHDRSGALVGGASTYLDDLHNGDTKPFSIWVYDQPEFTDFQVYASLS